MSQGVSLDNKVEEFKWVFPWGTTLIETLALDGATISYARSWKDMVWFLWILLPASLQEAFGTAAQVLLVAVKGEAQSRDLERARVELYRSTFKLDLDLVVICDERPQLAERLQRMPGRWGQWVPWPASREGMCPLQDQLRIHLPRHDLFEEKNPVRGRGVIGRDSDIADLTSRIERGESVGIFGLRKIGKTSVVRAATDILDPTSAQISTPADAEPATSDARALVCWLDVQRIFDRSSPRLFTTLADVIRRRLLLHEMDPPHPNGAPIEQVDVLLSFALRSQTLPVCIVLDEYDYMFGGAQGQMPMTGVSDLLRMLRGWAQESGRLSIVVIGRDPLPLQRPELEGFPNPMLGWFATRRMGPLVPDRAAELLYRIGRRVGLLIEGTTAERGVTLTGGHPLLLRQYGSALLAATRSGPLQWPQPTSNLETVVAPVLFERSEVREICNEIMKLLASRFGPAYQKLLQFAFSGIPRHISAAQWNGLACETLRNFGLLLGTDNAAWVPETLLQFIRKFESPPWAQADNPRYAGEKHHKRRRGK